MRRATVAIGLRLAVGGGRTGLVRVALVATGVGLGVALLLAALGMLAAREARSERELAREPLLPLKAPKNRSYLLQSVHFDRFHGRALVRIRLAAVGDRPPVPPGLERAPRAGELVVSPELGDLLRSREGSVLRPRLPGRIVAEIGKEGLAWPGELRGYGGVRRSEAATPEFVPVAGFGSERRTSALPLVAKLALLLAVLGLLVPTLAFIGASSRVAAAARERRLAAIRLVGATPAQARLLAAVESGLAAALGCLAGIVLFVVSRPLAAALAPAGHEVFASDVVPPLAQVSVIVVTVPLLAIAAGLVALRRIELSPLGIVRRRSVRQAGAQRVLPLALGLAALGLAWLDRGAHAGDATRGAEARAVILVGAAFALLVAGIAAATPWVAAVAARVLARRTASVGTLIAARRLGSEATSAGRLVSGAVVAVFVATVAHGFLPVLVGASGADSTGVSAVRSGTVFIGTGAPPGALADALRGVPGVREVATVGRAGIAPERADDGALPADLLVADCLSLNRVLVRPLPRCGERRAYRLLPPSPYVPALPAGTKIRLQRGGGRAGVVAFRLPRRLTGARVSRALLGDASVLLAPGALPPGVALDTYSGLVATDGRQATVERVRNALARAGIVAEVATAKEYESARGQTAEIEGVVGLIELAALLVLAIAAAGLLVASIDSVLERRRPLAVLAALGTPASALRRAVLVHAAIPLACGLTLAAAAALLTSVVLVALAGEAVELPLRPLAALAALATGAVLGVTALTLPTLGRALRPETLRSE